MTFKDFMSTHIFTKLVIDENTDCTSARKKSGSILFCIISLLYWNLNSKEKNIYYLHLNVLA